MLLHGGTWWPARSTSASYRKIKSRELVRHQHHRASPSNEAAAAAAAPDHPDADTGELSAPLPGITNVTATSPPRPPLPSTRTARADELNTSDPREPTGVPGHREASRPRRPGRRVLARNEVALLRHRHRHPARLPLRPRRHILRGVTPGTSEWHAIAGHGKMAVRRTALEGIAPTVNSVATELAVAFIQNAMATRQKAVLRAALASHESQHNHSPTGAVSEP